MLIVCGALVNGPYALITTAVSADLVRGAPRTLAPAALHTQKAAPPFPEEYLLGFCILALFSNTSEAQRRRAGLSHLALQSVPSLKHGFFFPLLLFHLGCTTLL